MYNPKHENTKTNQNEKQKKQAVFNPSYLINYNYNVEYLVGPFWGIFKNYLFGSNF